MFNISYSISQQIPTTSSTRKRGRSESNGASGEVSSADLTHVCMVVCASLFYVVIFCLYLLMHTGTCQETCSWEGSNISSSEKETSLLCLRQSIFYRAYAQEAWAGGTYICKRLCLPHRSQLQQTYVDVTLRTNSVSLALWLSKVFLKTTTRIHFGTRWRRGWSIGGR